MNINLKFLLLGTALSLIPTTINAQCVATTDCATLGYTQTSCPDGKGLKCPFGNTYACPASDKSVCEKYGFKYTCTGTGYTDGVGQSCNKQYTSCICTENYEWKDGKCEKKPGGTLGQCTGYAKNCSIGQILNSDGTCTTDKVSGKTPVGVVIYISADTDKCGYAMTASPIQTGIPWATVYNIDIPSLPNYTSWSLALTDFDVSGNMAKIIQAGDAASYPAAYAAFNYAPEGAPETKGKWALPTAGILNNFYPNLNTIKNAMSKLNGFIDCNEYMWLSNEYDKSQVWTSDLACHSVGVFGKSSNNTPWLVRPVIAF